MSVVLILARMTFRQAVRKKIVLTGLILGICFLLIFSVGFHLISAATSNVTIPGGKGFIGIINTERSSALLLAGLYTITFLAIAMAALLGADALAGEINSGIVQTVVTKPIRRSDVVFGKWLGFAGLLLLYFLLLAGGTSLSVFLQSGYTAPHMAAGLALIYLESLLVMTIALLCSSRFSALATGGVVFGLYGMAFIGGWVEQFGSVIQNQTAINVGIVTSLIVPIEALWHRAAFEMQTPLAGALGLSPFGTVSVPSVLMIAYAVLYLLVVVAWTVRVFQKRDL